MSTVTRHALRVYAALTELKGRDSDVLDALIPFFEPILSVMNGKIFDPHVFSAGVRKLYRWRFTGDVAAQFIPRMERKGFLRREAQTRAGTVWIVQYSYSSEENISSIVEPFEKIIDEFSTFPPRITDLLSYDRSRDELKDVLIRFLVSMDAHGEGAYAPELAGLDPGGATRELLAQLEEGGRPLDPNDRYMCARFVRHLIKKRPEFMPHLVRLGSIALLTEVVEDFLKPTQSETKVDLTIILDAPLALDYLGCSGKALQDDIATIIRELKKIGCTFIVLPVSCVEMQRNLRSMLALPVEQRRGYTHNALIGREVNIDFVVAVANNPEKALENSGITIRPISLNTNPNLHRYFSAEQYEDFFSSILWGNLVPAREHDATCATLIMRLREGRHSSDIFKCRYVMVTRNSTFVKHVRNYCLQSRMITEMQEGPVIYQRELATTAWLRTGLGADEAIPRGHLIATCERVLQVRPEVRNALAAQLAKITPERLDQFNLLMQDARSVQKLADQTLNNESVVTTENAEHLLNVMREATVEELREKHEAELAAERAAARDYMERSSAEIERLSDLVNASKNRELEIQRKIDTRIEGLIAAVNKAATQIEYTVAGILVCLGFAGGINHFIGVFDGFAIWNAILLAAGALGICRLIFGALERPMPGLVSVLNSYTSWTMRRRLARLGLAEQFVADELEFKGGRVKRISKAQPTTFP